MSRQGTTIRVHRLSSRVSDVLICFEKQTSVYCWARSVKCMHHLDGTISLASAFVAALRRCGVAAFLWEIFTPKRQTRTSWNHFHPLFRCRSLSFGTRVWSCFARMGVADARDRGRGGQWAHRVDKCVILPVFPNLAIAPKYCIDPQHRNLDRPSTTGDQPSQNIDGPS